MNPVSFLLNVVLLLTIFSALSLARTTNQYIGNAKHPEVPSSCFYEELELTVPVEKTVHPTNSKCAAITCRDDYVLLIQNCDEFPVNSECRVVPGDNSKPYPECCHTVDCK